MDAPAVHGPIPSPRQRAWHRREMYGFVHFTVNTFTDREWGYGDEPESLFAPSALDCDQWVAATGVVREGGWFEVASGTTIGAQRILGLTPAQGDAVRIRILSSQAPPVLSRLMVYAT